MRAAAWAVGMGLAVGLTVGCNKDKGGGAADGGAGAPPGVNQVGKRPRIPMEVALTDATYDTLDQRVEAEKKWSVAQVEFWTLATEPPPGLPFSQRPSGDGKGPESRPDPKVKVAWHGMPRADFMMARYGTTGLTIISVNVDPPEKRAAVLKYLEDSKAAMVSNYFWNDPSPDAKAKLAEKYKFTGKAPHQVVFDTRGKRVWATGDPFPYGARTFDELIFFTISDDKEIVGKP